MGWLIWKSFFEIFRLCEYKLTNSQNSSFQQQKAAIYLKNLHILIISSHRGQSSTQQYNNFQEKTKKNRKNPSITNTKQCCTKISDPIVSKPPVLEPWREPLGDKVPSCFPPSLSPIRTCSPLGCIPESHCEISLGWGAEAFLKVFEA